MNRLPATLLISFLAISYWAPRARAQDNAAEAVAVKTEIAFVLVVYGLTPGSQVIRIVYPDERVEIINLNSEKGVDPYVHRDKVVRSVFQRLYREGWVIESELLRVTEGYYILKREPK